MASAGRRVVEPRISASKLGEYHEALARRREQILRDQKYPPDVKVIPYERARQAIRAALMRRGDRVIRLQKLAESIEAQVPRSHFDEKAIRLSASAVRQFASLYPQLGIDNTPAALPGTPATYVIIEGVKVSVAPCVLLNPRQRNHDSWGALMLVLKKDGALTEHGGRIVAELVRRAMASVTQGIVDPKLCLVADVFCGRVFRARKQSARTGDEIASACREIAVRWPTLPPPRRKAA